MFNCLRMELLFLENDPSSCSCTGCPVVVVVVVVVVVIEVVVGCFVCCRWRWLLTMMVLVLIFMHIFSNVKHLPLPPLNRSRYIIGNAQNSHISFVSQGKGTKPCIIWCWRNVCLMLILGSCKGEGMVRSLASLNIRIVVESSTSTWRGSSMNVLSLGAGPKSKSLTRLAVNRDKL